MVPHSIFAPNGYHGADESKMALMRVGKGSILLEGNPWFTKLVGNVKKNWCGGNCLWEMEQNLCYLWNLSFGKKLFSRVLWKSIYQKSSDCGNRFLYSRPHGCQIWSFSYSLNFWFLFWLKLELKFYEYIFSSNEFQDWSEMC